MTTEALRKHLFEAYARPIVHMRRQIAMNRFGLIFGSGLSKSFGVPTWSELVDRIARDPLISGESLITRLSPRASLPYKTELLYQHFRRSYFTSRGRGVEADRKLDYEVTAEWLRILARHLYGAASVDFPAALRDHAYLGHYLPLIRQTPLTITYNFDTFLEDALFLTRPAGDAERSRGYETVTNPWSQFRRANAVIYHPHGVVPRKLMEAPVDRIVFSEASYAERLVGVMAGDHAGLLNHLSKNTCLLVGLSLEDEMLRNLLIQSARSNPGNYHYYVFFVKPDDEVDEGHRAAVRLANFKIYNLITLFLTEHEIAALGALLDTRSFGDQRLKDFLEINNLRGCFRYYFTGALGVGKSTSINHFRNLIVLDEWVEPRPEILAQPWDELTTDQREAADEWILSQFGLKNDSLRHEDIGIFVIDRPPLDPIAFTARDEWPEKALRLLGVVCPGEAKWRLQPGRIILLTDDPQELAVRMLLTDRAGYTPERLQEMDEALKEVYNMDRIIVLDTRGMTIYDVVKRLAEIIHLEEYKECDMHERLLSLATHVDNNDSKA